MRAQVIGGLPGDLVGSLTGLTQGRFPIHAKSTYAGQLNKKGNKVKTGNAAMVVESDGTRRGIKIFSKRQRAGDRRQRRPGRQDRPHQAPGPLRDAPGRLRQHLHLRATSARSQATYPAPKDRTRAARAPRPATDADAPARRVEDAHAGPQGDGARSSPASRVAPRAARQGAPVRPPGSPRRPRGRRRRPARRGAGRRRGDAGRPARLQAPRLPSEAAQEGRARDRRHDPRPPRQAHAERRRRTCCSRSAPPAPAPRGSTRSRSSTAGSCSSRPRSTAPRARTRSSAPTPRTRRSASCCCSARSSSIRRVLHDSRIQIYGCGLGDVRSGQIDRRVLATMLYLAGIGPEADDHLAQVRARLPDELGQRVRALDRHGDGHRRDQRHRHPPVDPGPGLDHRRDDPGAAQAPGHDEAAPDHLPDDLRRRRQHARPGQTTTITSTSAGARCTARTGAPRGRSTPCSSRTSGSS